jgi:GNAT superfamily N-acetyltransferase
MQSTSALLAAYDAQVRTALATRQPDGVSIDWDGPLMRVTGMHQGFVNYRDLAGLEGDALDEVIARTCAFFAERGDAFEWKTHRHDVPADLSDHLVTAGFVPGEVETVVIGEAAELVGTAEVPDGVEIRHVTEVADFVRIGAMESAVWGEDWYWLADDLAARQTADPDNIAVLIAEAGGHVVSAAWLVYNPGTEFAGLWGGSTLVPWRGKGIYRALVARRAELALSRGYRYLQVDASDDSRPILQRLGFEAVTSTTPYIWTPA